MAEVRVPYQLNDRQFEGMIVYDDTVQRKRPVVFMQPDWKGVCADTVAQVRQVGQVRVGSVIDASNQQFYRQGGSGIRSCGGCPQVTGPRWWERRSPCISTPAATLQTLPANGARVAQAECPLAS
jgi:hypothetical protein